MKRTDKARKGALQAFRTGIAVITVCAAVFAAASCDTGTTDEPAPAANPPASLLGTEFDTYYLNISAAELAGLEGFHIKNKSGAKAGIVIDRIFASQTKSTAGAVDVFTFDDPETGSRYWGFGAGSIAGGVWSSGELAAPVAPETEVYSTGFATKEFAGAVYVGVVAKKLSAEVSGDELTFEPIIGNPKPELGKTFKEFFAK